MKKKNKKKTKKFFEKLFKLNEKKSKKKKKKKAFTLIELLAVIVILGVIMIIAIPSVTSYITNARKDSYLSDAKMFINAAKTKLTADATLPQEAGSKVVVPISDIALDKGGEKSPYGNDWDYENSFIVVENIGTSSDPEYVWQVALNDTKGNCIPLTDMNDLKRATVGTNCSIENPLGYTLIYKMKQGAVLDNISSTYVSAKTGIVYNEQSSDTNGKGVYLLNTTANNANPIYYYRGDITNNNVRFANFCWKIVRTTETGGIKLIYNGVPAEDGSCNNTGEASQIGKSMFNSGGTSLIDIGYMHGGSSSRYAYKTLYIEGVTTEMTFGNDVTYDSSTKEYTLKDTIPGVLATDGETIGSKYHYVCVDNSGSLTNSSTCSKVGYIIYIETNFYCRYIVLENGATIESAIEEMTTGTTNSTNSPIKTTIDNWYASNMTAYTSKLEDTVWCYDRSIYSYGGWDKDTNAYYGRKGGITGTYLRFNGTEKVISDNTPSLTCINKVDRFTVNNTSGNGKLTYPVGLLTTSEVMLAGNALVYYGTEVTPKYLSTGVRWWLGTPDYLGQGGPNISNIDNSGSFSSYWCTNNWGVRPTVSLKSGTIVTEGDGTVTNPYVVE